MTLRRAGHTVTTAVNGAEALYLLTEQLTSRCDNPDHELFDVVLMDLQMPVMDGLEATCRLRKVEAAQNCGSGVAEKLHFHQRIIGESLFARLCELTFVMNGV